MWQWIYRVRALEEHRRKKIFVLMVMIVFVILLSGWILAIRLGFVDMQASWMSGTRTYSASGTLETIDLNPLRKGWDQTKDVVGDAWNNVKSILEGSSLPTTSSTSILLPSTSSTPKIDSTSTSYSNTSL